MLPFAPSSLYRLKPVSGQPPSYTGTFHDKVSNVLVPETLEGAYGLNGSTQLYLIKASLSSESPLKLVARTLN